MPDCGGVPNATVRALPENPKSLPSKGIETEASNGVYTLSLPATGGGVVPLATTVTVTVAVDA
jgi:hypothetical protein